MSISQISGSQSKYSPVLNHADKREKTKPELIDSMAELKSTHDANLISKSGSNNSKNLSPANKVEQDNLKLIDPVEEPKLYSKALTTIEMRKQAEINDLERDTKQAEILAERAQKKEREQDAAEAKRKGEEEEKNEALEKKEKTEEVKKAEKAIKDKKSEYAEETQRVILGAHTRLSVAETVKMEAATYTRENVTKGGGNFPNAAGQTSMFGQSLGSLSLPYKSVNTVI